MRRLVLWLSVAAAVVALFSGAAVLRSASLESTWTELASVAELRDRFNADRDSTRIVLLLSPT